MTDAAVVVPTFGRTDRLARCLVSLAALDPAPELVILVDGNDEPVRLPPVLPPGLSVRREPNQGPAHARNTGYREARAQGARIVCFVDDDAVVGPDWFARHIDLHRELPKAGAVGGATTNLDPSSAIARYVHLVAWDVGTTEPGPVRTVPTVNVSYKSACLDDVGVFDELLRTNEDVELHHRINAGGWVVHYQPDLVVGHHFPTTWRALVRQQAGYGRGFVRARAAWPDMPGASFVTMPWRQAVLGTVPHVVREARRTRRDHGARLVPASVVRDLSFRAAALRERRRLERGA